MPSNPSLEQIHSAAFGRAVWHLIAWSVVDHGKKSCSVGYSRKRLLHGAIATLQHLMPVSDAILPHERAVKELYISSICCFAYPLCSVQTPFLQLEFTQECMNKLPGVSRIVRDWGEQPLDFVVLNL